MTLDAKAIVWPAQFPCYPDSREIKNINREFRRFHRKGFWKRRGLLVAFEPYGLPNDLPVWQHARNPLLHSPGQLWIDTASKRYRSLCFELFKDAMGGKDEVINHIMNRKLARALQYKYVRLLHVGRHANSSSGRGCETFAMTLLPASSRLNPNINTPGIVYDDPMELFENVGCKGLRLRFGSGTR